MLTPWVRVVQSSASVRSAIFTRQRELAALAG
jgi:hypothetical protein